MAQIIDGKKIAADIRAEISEKTAELLKQRSIQPGLALLLVGDNPASQVYVRNKAKACEEVGFFSFILEKPDTTSEAEILKIIDDWNNDPEIHGILVQLPLPKHVNENKVIQAISPQKDVDGFHPENVGRLVIGLPGFVSCTPAGVVELLKRSGIETKGKHVVVVGRSNIVGKPMANLMYQKNQYANAVVTICHTGAPDITLYTKQADILIAAVGVPHLLKRKDIKEGAVVIDVGMNKIDDATRKSGSRLVGDVDYDDVAPIVSALTPVPGGVGPMTIAMLLKNTFMSASGEVKL
jgi:methylenetetrahydrofolate dehydrogenase (NADP+)/methenyltetrahydrofolate cyclohydrolase